MKGIILVLALVAAVSALADERPAPAPYSCRLLYDEQKKCAFDPHCDKRVVERLTKECLRDGGRLDLAKFAISTSIILPAGAGGRWSPDVVGAKIDQGHPFLVDDLIRRIENSQKMILYRLLDFRGELLFVPVGYTLRCLNQVHRGLAVTDYQATRQATLPTSSLETASSTPKVSLTAARTSS
jgi:hypothetical protein